MKLCSPLSMRAFNPPSGMNLPESGDGSGAVVMASYAFLAPMIRVEKGISRYPNGNRLLQIAHHILLKCVIARKH